MSTIGEWFSTKFCLYRFADSVYRNNNRQAEIKELTAKGILPHEHELEKHPEKSIEGRPWLMGDVSAMINVSQNDIINHNITSCRVSKR